MAFAFRRIGYLASVLGLFPSAAATAQDLPAGLSELLREANDAERKSIEDVAKRLYPDKRQQIDDVVDDIEDDEKAKVAQSTLVEGWKGQASVGANWSTGNTDELDLSLALNAKRKSPKWEHKLAAYADFTRTNGIKTAERLGLSYRLRRDFKDSPWFVFGTGSYERDRFQGVDRRFTEIAGLGYQIIDSDPTDWEVSLGPAMRQTRFSDGTHENRLAIAMGTDFEHDITDTLTFREQATFVLDEQNTTLNSVTSLTSNIYGRLSGSISFTLDLETDPPTGAEKLDTYTKASLIIEM